MVRNIHFLCVVFGLILSACLATPSLGADHKTSKALTAAEIFKRAAPAVVAIDCLGDQNAKIGTASGFILSDNGKIATNFHVIKSCKNLSVRLANGDVYDTAWVIAFDVRRDLALIRIRAASLPVLPLAESNDIEIGDTVYSLGNPKGLQNTLQQGLVSAFREFNGSRLVQVAASINPGNSGGPILNAQGRVVAIAVAKITEAENLGFAIPIDYLKGYLDSKEETAFPAFAASLKPLPAAPTIEAKPYVAPPGYSTISIAPIFSQLLTFTIPKGFQPASEKVNGPTYIQESVLAGEPPEQWTQKIRVLGAKGLASKPDLSPKKLFEAGADNEKLHCQNSFAAADLFEGKIDGRDAFVGVASCGSVLSAVSHSETALLVNIKGDNEYYSIGWEEKGALSSTPIPIDTAKWMERFKALSPIALCPIVPGETAPYQSCLDKIASDAREALAHAKELLNQKRFSEALALLEESGLSGNAEARHYAGDMYRTGLGVSQDYNEARQWYEKAAEKGDAAAANAVGMMYFNGQGGAQDIVQARSFFEKAAAAGNSLAMNYLGLLYYRGHGVAQDYTQARQWLEKAAAAGDVNAMDNLGAFYEKGFGVAQDFTQARLWYQKALAAGYLPAKAHLEKLPK
jgi:S1-C subfamily serine protease